MSVKIYWGAPGSYKTSSAVMDDVSVCAREGRTLITNIRGLREDLIREHVPGEVPLSFNVVSLRNDRPDEIERLRKWWHWAPVGAYVVMDEVQIVYPPEWSRAEIAELSIPDDQPRVIGDNGIPHGLYEAFEQHRHGNWDMTFCTINIKRVRPEIRASCETAYKHKNLAIHGAIGRGKFRQYFHSAQDNGTPSQVFQSRERRIKSWVFKCYASTATGAVSDTRAGISIFANPRVLLLGAVAVGAVALMFVAGLPTPIAKALGFETRSYGAISGSSADHQRTEEAAAAAVSQMVAAGGPVRVSREVRRAAGPTVTVMSQSYRLVGVFQRGASSYALVYGRDGEFRYPLSACRLMRWNGWQCTVDGQVVTEMSGPQPPEVPRYKPEPSSITSSMPTA